MLNRGVRHGPWSVQPNHRRRYTKDPSDLFYRELAALKHLSLLAIRARLHKLRATRQHTRPVSLFQPLVPSLKRVDQILRLLLRQVARELNHSRGVGTVGEVARRKLIQRLRQAERLLQLVHPAHTLERTRPAHLGDVENVLTRQHGLAPVNDELAQTSRRVPANVHTGRVKRLQSDDVAVAVAEDLHHRAMRQQHRHDDLLVILDPAGAGALGLVHPSRPRPIGEPVAVAANERVHRQR